MDEADTVRARLEADLAAAGTRSQVLNAGTHGYSTDQEYLFYREQGVLYGASDVVCPRSRTRRPSTTPVHLPLLDLRGALRAASDSDRTYFRVDDHWTAVGNGVAARAIARSLRPSG